MKNKRHKGYRSPTLHTDLAYMAGIAAVIAAVCVAHVGADHLDAKALELEEAQHQAVQREIQEYAWADTAEMARETNEEIIANFEAWEDETIKQEAELIEAVEEEPEPELVNLGEFVISHYCPCEKCCGKTPDHPAYGITATGTVATEGRTIAVDPNIIPYGTEVVIRYKDGTEHTYIAEDCGGAINGNDIDVFMDSHEAALIEGLKYAEVFIREVAE